MSVVCVYIMSEDPHKRISTLQRTQVSWALAWLTAREANVRESYIFVSEQLRSTAYQSALDANIYVGNKRVARWHLDADSVNGVGNKFSGINWLTDVKLSCSG